MRCTSTSCLYSCISTSAIHVFSALFVCRLPSANLCPPPRAAPSPESQLQPLLLYAPRAPPALYGPLPLTPLAPYLALYFSGTYALILWHFCSVSAPPPRGYQPRRLASSTHRHRSLQIARSVRAQQNIFPRLCTSAPRRSHPTDTGDITNRGDRTYVERRVGHPTPASYPREGRLADDATATLLLPVIAAARSPVARAPAESPMLVPAVRRDAVAHEHGRAGGCFKDVVDTLDLQCGALLVRSCADSLGNALSLFA